MKEQLKMKLIGSAGLEAKGIDLDPTTIWRKEKAGEFPKHVLVGNRRAWVESEIDSYIEGLIANRDAAIDGNNTDETSARGHHSDPMIRPQKETL
jgi:hypothetical protein